jgi:PAS domain S-box-containing protein
MSQTICARFSRHIGSAGGCSVSDKSFRADVAGELQAPEATFRAIFETSAVGIGIMGLDRKLIEANPAMCRMFGRSCEELIGQTPAIVTYPDDYAESTEAFMEMLAGKREYFWAERRYVCKNGEVFWAHTTTSVVRDAAGTPLYLVGMMLDIDDRKRVALALQESEVRFRAMFESSAIGMAIMTLDGRLLEANAAVCRMSGYTEQELQGRYDYQNVYPEDLDLGIDLFGELLAGQREAYSIEKRYIRKNGEVFWTRLTLSAVRDTLGQAEYLVVMVEDIDAQKCAALALRESEARFRAMFENAAIGMRPTVNQRTSPVARASSVSRWASNSRCSP